MLLAGEKKRTLIELFLDSSQNLEDVEVSIILLENIKDSDRERIEKLSKKLAQDRMKTALKINKKICRNQSCPCGSGKKYKKCCR